MIDKMRVVAVTFAGRRETMRLLAPLITRHKGIIDQWLLCWNVRQAEDEAFVRSLADDSDFVSIMPRSRNHRGFHDFYIHLYDRDSLYVKLDDDIIWAEPDALLKLIRFRMEHREYSVVSANVINNVRLSHLHQRFGMIGWEQAACWDPCDAVGWKDGRFAEQVHRRFISCVESGDVSGWKFNLFEMNGHERFSINCIAFFGADIADVGGVPYDDEIFLTTEFGKILGKRPVFYGQPVVSHYSFGPQFEHLRKTDILSRYAMIMNGTEVREP